MKENNNGNDTNVGSIGNSIEEDIKILEELRIANENCIKNAKIKDNPFVAIWEKQNRTIEHILSDYKRVLKENEEFKEYIVIAPNLDEMTAIKYRNIRRDAYLQGRVEEQQKAEQIINENYIPKQKVKEKIEEEKLPLTIVGGRKNKKTLEYGIKLGRRQALQELLESEE